MSYSGRGRNLLQRYRPPPPFPPISLSREVIRLKITHNRLRRDSCHKWSLAQIIIRRNLYFAYFHQPGGTCNWRPRGLGHAPVALDICYDDDSNKKLTSWWWSEQTKNNEYFFLYSPRLFYRDENTPPLQYHGPIYGPGEISSSVRY